MKKYIFPFAIVLAVTLPTTGLAVTILTQDAERSIRENCVDAQQDMQSLQRTDPVSRISRGNTYANMQRLMTAMSARSAANAYNIPELTETTNEFTNLKTEFTTNYTEYEIDLRNLATMRCESDTILFYDRLENVRQEREQVAQNIKDMDKQIELFEKAVLKLNTQLKARQDEQ